MKNKARSKLADVLADIKNGKAQVTPKPKTPQIQTTVAKITKPVAVRKTKTRVLKLFNRCVDLAQFDNKDEPQLYPVCRAWLHGYQQNKQQKDQGNLDSHEDETKTTTDNQVSNDEPQDISQLETANTTINNTTNEIHSMPPPKTKKEAIDAFNLDVDGEDLEHIDLRIPNSVRNFKPSRDLEETFDKSSTMNHLECMALNKYRWKQIKKDWSEARKIHEYRYEESFKILCG